MKHSLVLSAQSVYYLLTGLWPLLHIRSFMAVTGPKSDYWLVQMVGLLTVSIALTLFYCSRRSIDSGRFLGVLSALAYTCVDVYFSLNNVIPRIYLADAVAEVIFIIMLILPPNKPRPD